MKFKGKLELEHGLKQIHIAPLIAVVFQLLIFFMLTSGFVNQSGISVNLPKAITSEVVKYQDLDILVSAGNTVYLDDKAITMQELKLLLKQAAKRGQTILIKADKRASLGGVVEIWDTARDLGAAQVNIATNQ